MCVYCSLTPRFPICLLFAFRPFCVALEIAYKKALEENKERHAAATVIGCLVRKHNAVRTVAETRFQLQLQAANTALDRPTAAAAKMQRSYRRRAVNAWLRSLDRALRFDGGMEGPDMDLDERKARRNALVRYF